MHTTPIKAQIACDIKYKGKIKAFNEFIMKGNKVLPSALNGAC